MALVNLVSAYNYNITYSCQKGICIVGQKAEWFVNIDNKGRNNIEVTALEFRDSVNPSKIIASVDFNYNPLSSERGDIVTIYPLTNGNITLTGILPNPNKGQLLLYYPCITTAVSGDDRVYIKESVLRYCHKVNESMPLFQCNYDEHCKYDERCKSNKCLKLDCKKCQYIFENKCMDYQCCENEQCISNQACVNNTCISLSCKYNEYVFNHTCNLLNCNDNEYIFNKSCTKLNCSLDAVAFNNTCIKLSCKEDEYLAEHKCSKLNCRENEAPINHVCKVLNCNFNETIINHKCIPLNCYFYQTIKEHRCVTESRIILKMVIEIIALIAIVGFLALDFMKIKKKKGKK